MKKILFIIATIIAAACTVKGPELLDPKDYSGEIDGKQLCLYTLHAGDIYMQVSNYGGHVVSLYTPDRYGNYEDIVLGRPSIQEYIDCPGERFLGATVGIYANRIAKGHFTLDGKEYTCPQNNDENTLHGGLIGIDRAVWDVVEVSENKITFSYCKPDLQDGFPGNVTISTTYELTADNEFKVSYLAQTDAPTVINLSHHSFFNLRGEGNGDILSHQMQIIADGIIPVGEDLIPTGEIMNVAGTPFDFNESHEIGERIGCDDPQLRNGNGYDHCWVLSKTQGDLAVSVYEPSTGRQMDVLTDQPGVQFYSGNFFDGKHCGKNGKPFIQRCAIVLETQKFPDSPNQPQFPSTVLRPGEVYTHWCTYRFSAR